MNRSYEKTLDITEFNNLLECLDCFTELDLKQRGSAVILNYNDCKYHCSLTGEKKNTPNTGNIMAQFNKIVGVENYELPNKELYGYQKIKRANKKGYRIKWDLQDPGNYIYANPRFVLKQLYCYSYDINSAYSYAMTKPMPDTKQPARFNDFIKEGEIGFYRTGGVSLEVGEFAEYIFPLIESPYTNYVNCYYNKKKAAKSPAERQTWKYFLNVMSGMIARHNIFHRLAILYYARTYIESFQDDETMYCNTDSIISKKRRPDLPFGIELGQFKEEHANELFKYKQPGIYQWENKCHYTGIPGCAIIDIEKTDNWLNNLPYELDLKNRRIVDKYAKLKTE